MNKKPMNKKTTIIVFAMVIVAAVFLGAIFTSKGDGPVMGMILANRTIEDTTAYSDAAKAHEDGTYIVISNAFNQYQTDYETSIPLGEDLYAILYFVECPQGSEFTGKWIKDDIVIKEGNGILTTGPAGVISYTLGGESIVTGGNYTFELYDGDKMIFEYTFSVG